MVKLSEDFHLRSHMRHKQKKTLQRTVPAGFFKKKLTLNDKLFHVFMRWKPVIAAKPSREQHPFTHLHNSVMNIVFPATVKCKLSISFIIYPKCSDLKPDYLRK